MFSVNDAFPKQRRALAGMSSRLGFGNVRHLIQSMVEVLEHTCIRAFINSTQGRFPSRARLSDLVRTRVLYISVSSLHKGRALPKALTEIPAFRLQHHYNLASFTASRREISCS